MTKNIYKIVDDLSKFEATVEINGGVAYDDVKSTVAMIKNVMNANRDIVALCAPQVGVNLRLFCVKSADKKINTFVNPMVVNKSKETHLSRETNPSIKDKQFIIPRNDEVHVAYQHTDGRVDSNTYKGVYGEVVQQMIEMLDGITLADYGLDLDLVGGPEAFDKAPQKDKVAVVEMYLNNLKQNAITYMDDVKNNAETKAINDQIEFNIKYLNGEIKPVDKDGNIVEAKGTEK